jgi:predicted RNA-binding protein YlxR (DUF448 family)
MPEVLANAHKHTATRTCVGCGKRADQAGLLRLQLGRDVRLHVVAMAGAGRSAYLHPDDSCFARLGKSRKSQLLARSLRQSISDEQKAWVLRELQERPQCAPTNGLTKA